MELMKKQINWLLKREFEAAEDIHDFDAETCFIRELIELAKFDPKVLLACGINACCLQDALNFINLLDLAYEEYKKQWCKLRNLDYEKTQKLFDNDEETKDGMFACREEFEDCEFSDESSMKELLNSESFEAWKNLYDKCDYLFGSLARSNMSCIN